MVNSRKRKRVDVKRYSPYVSELMTDVSEMILQFLPLIAIICCIRLNRHWYGIITTNSTSKLCHEYVRRESLRHSNYNEKSSLYEPCETIFDTRLGKLYSKYVNHLDLDLCEHYNWYTRYVSWFNNYDFKHLHAVHLSNLLPRIAYTVLLPITKNCLSLVDLKIHFEFISSYEITYLENNLDVHLSQMHLVLEPIASHIQRLDINIPLAMHTWKIMSRLQRLKFDDAVIWLSRFPLFWISYASVVCSTLFDLNLSGVTFISDDNLVLLMRALPILEYLNLVECNQLTAGAFEGLIGSVPHLHTLHITHLGDREVNKPLGDRQLKAIAQYPTLVHLTMTSFTLLSDPLWPSDIVTCTSLRKLTVLEPSKRDRRDFADNYPQENCFLMSVERLRGFHVLTQLEYLSISSTALGTYKTTNLLLPNEPTLTLHVQDIVDLVTALCNLHSLSFQLPDGIVIDFRKLHVLQQLHQIAPRLKPLKQYVSKYRLIKVPDSLMRRTLKPIEFNELYKFV